MSVVAWIRAVNVGTSPRLPMADLRAVAEACGYGRPRTYLQSGNLVVDTDEPPARVEATLEEAIAARTKVAPAVVARSHRELRSAIAANPFADRGADPTRVHVVFHRDPVGRLALDPPSFLPEELCARGRELYLYLPGGIGRSPLARALDRRRPAPVATTRNWRTVLAVADLL